MIIYLAGGVSGNLKPAWKHVARGMTIKEALLHEDFWQGGEGHKRHIFQDLYLSPVKENEAISCKPSHSYKVQGGGRDSDKVVRGFL